MAYVKVSTHRIVYLIVASTFVLSSHSAYSKTINLPEEYSSIQEAVEAASSGDVIQINRHDVYFLPENPNVTMIDIRKGVPILNKNITIVGNVSGERARIIHSHYTLFTQASEYSRLTSTITDNAIVIENAYVRLKNIEMSVPALSSTYGFLSPPVLVLSGGITLENVCFTGNLIVHGNLEIVDSIVSGIGSEGYIGYRDDPQKKGIPAVYVCDRDSPTVRILDSEIQCDTDLGAKAITFERIENAAIQIERSRAVSGNCFNISIPGDGFREIQETYWVDGDKSKGWAGFLIVNCTDVVVDMDRSSVMGSATNYYQYSKRIPSGPGIEILNSKNVTIQGGDCIGGNGRNGGIPDPSSLTRIHSGDGGAGIHITNSTVTLNNVTALGGRGGEGDSANGVEPGVDGQPIYYDENSTVVFGSAVEDWEIYQ